MTNAHSEHKTFPIPTAYFGMSLGTLALGLAWRYGASEQLLPAWAAEAIVGWGGIVWLLLAGAYLVKLTAFREQVQNEWHHDIQAAFTSLLPITGVLFGVGLLPYQHTLAAAIIGVFIVFQLVFAAWHIGGLWRGTHVFSATTPVIYLPTVASNFVSAIGLAALGLADYGILFLGAGVLSWLSLEPVILQRLRSETPVPHALHGAIGIQLAPAFVACNAYFATHGAEADFVVLFLIGYGLLQLLMPVRLWPWLTADGLHMGFWGFSFGLASMAACGLHLMASARLVLLGEIMWIGSSAAIALLWLMTFWLMVKGRFWLR